MALPKPASNEPAAPLAISALRIVQASLREETSVSMLAQYAESDPGFALRVLSFVNSAAFGSRRKVTDVKQAAALLGIRGLRNIGLGLALTDVAPQNEKGQAILGLCMRRATACKLVAEAVGVRDRDGYFTAGLFLDVGLLSLARRDLKTSHQIARLPARNRTLFERSLGMPDHTRAARTLDPDFHLPEDIVRAIEHHHDADPPSDDLARAAWIAERVAAAFEGGDEARLRADAVAALALEGIAEAQAHELLAKVPALAAEAAEGFGASRVSDEMLERTRLDAGHALAELNQSYESLVRRLEALISEKEELMTNLERANRSLELLAATDPLTSLANRRAVEAALARDLARAERDGTWVSIVALDVDHFKRVNDTYGHAIGDQVLTMVARLLRTGLRAGDLPARIGGEEFLLVLPNTNLDGAEVTAERLRKALAAARVRAPEGELTVTASFGISAMKGPGCSGGSSELIESADRALYAAKRNGRNRVERAA